MIERGTVILYVVGVRQLVHIRQRAQGRARPPLSRDDSMLGQTLRIQTLTRITRIVADDEGIIRDYSRNPRGKVFCVTANGSVEQMT